jgi:hypothetical protein
MLIAASLMDSKNIYISSERMKSLMVWPLLGDTEWEYLGAEQEADKEKVKLIINSYFEENDFYVVRDRRNSIECNKENIDEEIDPLLGSQDFIIWNKSFTRAIEFNRIGVLRRGKANR